MEKRCPLQPPMVAVIVLTWNQRAVTMDCLASLADLDYPRECVQVIVVDNGSNDGTCTAIEQSFPDVVVLPNRENLGFAGGNNVGIKWALASPAAYLLLLNNDTVVDPLLLRELVAVLEANPAVGIVGPKMLYYDQPQVIWCAGNRIDWRLGDSLRLQAEQPDVDSSRQPEEVDFVTACAILLRRPVVEQIGLLDPRFFIYYEETDWCLRAREVGWRILYVPGARLWHKVSAAMGATSPATEYYMSRNVLLFLARHRRGGQRAVSLGLAAGRSLLAIAAYTIKPQGGRRRRNRDARLAALRDAVLGHWGKMGPDVEAICYPGPR